MHILRYGGRLLIGSSSVRTSLLWLFWNCNTSAFLNARLTYHFKPLTLVSHMGSCMVMLTTQQANSSRISGASQFHRIKIILYYEYHFLQWSQLTSGQIFSTNVNIGFPAKIIFWPIILFHIAETKVALLSFNIFINYI